ncbi:MAG: holo-ACP synthase [Planctomycetota bacterium]
MGIVGTGIDIVEVARIEAVLERHGRRFLRRVFTEREIEYANSGGAPAEHLAGRFAVKEAVFKALGTGWAGRIHWRDVEVRSLPTGQPEVRLSGGACGRAEEQGIGRIHVSISHTGTHAVAHAIAEARCG